MMAKAGLEETPRKDRPERYPVLPAGLDDLVNPLGGHLDRLFDHDMLPRGGRGQGWLKVRAARGADRNDIHLVITQQLLEGLIRLLAELLGPADRQFWNPVEEPGHHGVVEIPDRLGLELADHPASNYTYTELTVRHVNPPL